MAGPSTQNLQALPGPARLRKLTQAIALLDEILCDDWESRYYSFDAAWDESSELASMRNGEGDHWFLWFGQAGLVLLGFDHESPMSPAARDGSLWPGLVDTLPEELEYALEEPAFEAAHLTFVIYRLASDDRYHIGPIHLPEREGSDPDGSAHLLDILDDNPATYASWASDYYDCKVDLAAVEKIYAHAPLDPDTVKLLRRDREFEEIAESARAMGYPVAGPTASGD